MSSKSVDSPEHDPRYIGSFSKYIFENYFYTVDLTITKHLNLWWPMPDRNHANESHVTVEQTLPEETVFLNHVRNLKLNITLDLNGLSNDQNVKFIKRQLDHFPCLKKALIVVRVSSIPRAFSNDTYWRTVHFFKAFSKFHDCIMKVYFVQDADLYFERSDAEKRAKDYASNLGLTKIEDLNQAFLDRLMEQPYPEPRSSMKASGESSLLQGACAISMVAFRSSTHKPPHPE